MKSCLWRHRLMSERIWTVLLGTIMFVFLIQTYLCRQYARFSYTDPIVVIGSCFGCKPGDTYDPGYLQGYLFLCHLMGRMWFYRLPKRQVVIVSYHNQKLFFNYWYTQEMVDNYENYHSFVSVYKPYLPYLITQKLTKHRYIYLSFNYGYHRGASLWSFELRDLQQMSYVMHITGKKDGSGKFKYGRLLAESPRKGTLEFLKDLYPEVPFECFGQKKVRVVYDNVVFGYLMRGILDELHPNETEDTRVGAYMHQNFDDSPELRNVLRIEIRNLQHHATGHNYPYYLLNNINFVVIAQYIAQDVEKAAYFPFFSVIYDGPKYLIPECEIPLIGSVVVFLDYSIPRLFALQWQNAMFYRFVRYLEYSFQYIEIMHVREAAGSVSLIKFSTSYQLRDYLQERLLNGSDGYSIGYEAVYRSLLNKLSQKATSAQSYTLPVIVLTLDRLNKTGFVKFTNGHVTTILMDSPIATTFDKYYRFQQLMNNLCVQKYKQVCEVAAQENPHRVPDKSCRVPMKGSVFFMLSSGDEVELPNFERQLAMTNYLTNEILRLNKDFGSSIAVCVSHFAEQFETIIPCTETSLTAPVYINATILDGYTFMEDFIHEADMYFSNSTRTSDPRIMVIVTQDPEVPITLYSNTTLINLHVGKKNKYNPSTRIVFSNYRNLIRSSNMILSKICGALSDSSKNSSNNVVDFEEEMAPENYLMYLLFSPTTAATTTAPKTLLKLSGMDNAFWFFFVPFIVTMLFVLFFAAALLFFVYKSNTLVH